MDDKRRARWPSRVPGNRLEPDCRPLMRPTFSLDPTEPVFTIGSCFARNIERRLKGLGFDVPTLGLIEDHPELTEGHGPEVLNKYTPPSIYQELVWTRQILDRDDQVRPSDIEPLLLHLPTGKVIDLQRRAFRPGGYSFEEILKYRKLFYSLFRRAFDCPSVIITLGLIECWRENATNQFVEFSPSVFEDKERFSFHVLDYNESFDYIQKCIDLLNTGSTPKILLTTSPVPLNRTFTDDDVIVANMYSKSVLRAVAGKIVATNANVNYFPSYETVMLTRRPEIFKSDLIHIEESFIGSIMESVIENYVPQDTRPVIDRFDQVERLIKDKKWDEAATVYTSLGGVQPTRPGEYYLNVAELERHRGNDSEADQLVYAAATVETQDPQYYYKVMRHWPRRKNRKGLEACRMKAVSLCETDAVKLRYLVRWLLDNGRTQDAFSLMNAGDAKFGTDPEFSEWLKRMLKGSMTHVLSILDCAEHVRILCDRLIASGHANAAFHLLYSRFLFRADDTQNGLQQAQQAFALGARDKSLMRQAAKAYVQSGAYDEAIKMLSVLCEIDPKRSSNFLQLVRCHAERGDWSEADKVVELAVRRGLEEKDVARLRKFAESQRAQLSAGATKERQDKKPGAMTMTKRASGSRPPPARDDGPRPQPN